MINEKNICEVLAKIEEFLGSRPYVDRLRDPFQVLVATVISARTKDEVTEQVSKKLFKKAKNARKLAELSEEEIAKIIYPAGFYRNKAKMLRELAKKLVKEYGGRVPDSMEELLKLPGVGRKTANLVLAVAFGKPAIAVDTHVHRIMNRWGFVKTKKPEQTEMELRKKLPKDCWLKVNRILVEFGRRICRPIKPKCMECPVREICPYYENFFRKG